MKKFAIAGGAIALTLGLSACSQPNVTVADASASASAPAKVADNSWESVTTFVEAQWDGETEKALALTEPGSPAERYAKYQIAADEAYVTNGQGSMSEGVAFSYVDDSDAGTVTITDQNDPTTEYIWSDFVVSPTGKVVTWTGASGPLEDALWSKDATAKAAGATIELVGAYKANSGNLFIVLDVEAGDKGATMAYDASYVVDGRSTKATYTVAPSSIEPNTKAYHVYVFENADFGGTFKADVMTEDYMTTGVAKFTVE